MACVHLTAELPKPRRRKSTSHSLGQRARMEFVSHMLSVFVPHRSRSAVRPKSPDGCYLSPARDGCNRFSIHREAPAGA